MAEQEVCYHGVCMETDTQQCDACDKWFCLEHGQQGGDRQVQDVGAVAYPAICADCLARSGR